MYHFYLPVFKWRCDYEVQSDLTLTSLSKGVKRPHEVYSNSHCSLKLISEISEISDIVNACRMGSNIN